MKSEMRGAFRRLRAKEACAAGAEKEGRVMAAATCSSRRRTEIEQRPKLFSAKAQEGQWRC